MHPNWRWRWLDTFDWYTPKYQWKLLYPEVIRWFRANGFLDITVFDIPIQMRGVKTNQERPPTGPVLKFIEPERGGRRSEDCSMEVPG
jgi:hypothetical protein